MSVESLLSKANKWKCCAAPKAMRKALGWAPFMDRRSQSNPDHKMKCRPRLRFIVSKNSLYCSFCWTVNKIVNTFWKNATKMISLPNGCRCSEPKVNPSNWNNEGLLINSANTFDITDVSVLRSQVTMLSLYFSNRFPLIFLLPMAITWASVRIISSLA